MIVYIGSTREAKVEGAREALAAIAARDPRYGGVEIRARDVGDAAPPMPMTEAEILLGARRRAAALLEALREGPEERFALGVEGGVDPMPPLAGDEGSTRYALKTWACVTDGRRWSYGAGGAVLLPAAVAREVVAGRELGDVIDRLAGGPIRGTRGAWGLFTKDLWTRRDAFRLAVLSAFAPFFNGDLYDRP